MFSFTRLQEKIVQKQKKPQKCIKRKMLVSPFSIHSLYSWWRLFFCLMLLCLHVFTLCRFRRFTVELSTDRTHRLSSASIKQRSIRQTVFAAEHLAVRNPGSLLLTYSCYTHLTNGSWEHCFIICRPPVTRYNQTRTHFPGLISSISYFTGDLLLRSRHSREWHSNSMLLCNLFDLKLGEVVWCSMVS